MTVERIDEARFRVLIAERIKARRLELSLTQGMLADRSEVSKQFMCDLEGGTTTANALVYMRLASTLKVSVQFLLTGEQPPKPDLSLRQLVRLADSAEKATKLLEDIRDIAHRIGNK